jgi:hypothetical protein
MDLLVECLAALGHQATTFDPPGSARALMRHWANIRQPVDAFGTARREWWHLAYALGPPTGIDRLVLVGTGVLAHGLLGALLSRERPSDASTTHANRHPAGVLVRSPPPGASQWVAVRATFAGRGVIQDDIPLRLVPLVGFATDRVPER